MQRKIHRFESVVLKEITTNKEGLNPDRLGLYSSKFIYACCRFCGEPHRIRKSFFTKSGSACHKKCKIEEQKILSPFKNKEIRDKARQVVKRKYGFEYASQNKDIALKISRSKKNQKHSETVDSICSYLSKDNINYHLQGNFILLDHIVLIIHDNKESKENGRSWSIKLTEQHNERSIHIYPYEWTNRKKQFVINW